MSFRSEQEQQVDADETGSVCVCTNLLVFAETKQAVWAVYVVSYLPYN